MDENHDFTDLLPKVKKRESVSVYLQLLQGRFISDSQNAFVLLLNLFDIGILLDSFDIILFPFTERLNSCALELLKSESFVVVCRVEASLRKLQLAYIVLVLQ